MNDLETRRQRLLDALQGLQHKTPLELARTSQVAIERAKANFGLPTKPTAVLSTVQKAQAGLRQKGLISTGLRPGEWKHEALDLSRKAAAPLVVVGFLLDWWSWIAFIVLPFLWFVLKRAKAWVRVGGKNSTPREWELASLLDAWQAQVLNELDGDSRVLIRQISQRCSGLLTHFDALQSWQPEHAFTLESSITRYLPDAVSPLLMIPSDKRNQTILGRSDTPQSLLHEQLRAIDQSLEQIENEWTAYRSTDLLVHKRFLENRSGR
jgi:hypothetical protein